MEDIIHLYYNGSNIQIKINLTDPLLQTRADNTVSFLNKVYNGTGTNSYFFADLRKEIIRLLALFISETQNYSKSKLKAGSLSRIKSHLRKDNFSEVSAFISFKKGWLEQNDYPLFKVLYP